MQGLNMTHRISLIIVYKGRKPGEAFLGTVYPTFRYGPSMVSPRAGGHFRFYFGLGILDFERS